MLDQVQHDKKPMPHSLLSRAEQLVASRIPGKRKGSDKPAYRHSFDVRDVLAAEGYDEDVCLSGLLHDILEDSDVTVGELKDMGCSPRVLELIGLCSHENVIDGNDERWVCMMAGLVRANNTDAWAIKIADIICNIEDSVTMPEDRRHMLRFVKGRMLVSITQKTMHKTALWKRLEKACMFAL